MFSDIDFRLAIGEYLPTKIGEVQQPLSQTILKHGDDPYAMMKESVLCRSKRGDGIYVQSGKAYDIKNINNCGTHVSFNVKTDGKSAVLELPKTYYLGYKAYVKRKKLNVHESKHGYVAVDVPANFKGKISVYFGMSHATIFGLILTLVTIASLIGAVIMQKIKGKN